MRARAFSLIEVLVAMTLIAVLMSLVSSSLRAARDQAKSLACAASVRELYRGFTHYDMQFDYWLPGTPVTTGRALLQQPATLEVDLPGIPTQTWDWAGPVAYYGFGWDLSNNRRERMEFLREKIFLCPSNNFLDGIYPDDAPDHGWPTVMRMNSYSTVREMMWLPPRAGPDGIGLDDRLRPRWSWGTITPLDHAPRFTHVKKPSMKVLLHEGSRYWTKPFDPQEPALHSTSVRTRDLTYEYGGSFSDAPPPSSYSRSFANPIETGAGHDPRKDRTAYRHRAGSGESGMRVAFFDGHVELLSKREAIEGIDYWYPSGSLIAAFEFASGRHRKPRATEILKQRPPRPVEGYDRTRKLYPIY